MSLLSTHPLLAGLAALLWVGAACLLPFIYRLSGWIYLAAALVLNAGRGSLIVDADLIAALYGNHARGVIETQVRFEDGRSGWLRADLAIEAARTVAMEVAA